MNCNLRVIEDEYHVILICPIYFNLRIQIILPEYDAQLSLELFYQLINNICLLSPCLYSTNKWIECANKCIAFNVLVVRARVPSFVRECVYHMFIGVYLGLNLTGAR